MRFIPAYAGNARRQAVVLDGEPVHPRIRGERHKFLGIVLPVIGSSPHTRGTLGEGTGKLRVGRFIPAYAGNAQDT